MLLPTGELAPRLVCATCAAGSVQIVPVRDPNALATCKHCPSRALYCDEHRTRAPELEILADKLRTYLKALEATRYMHAHIPSSLATIEGKGEGLESALGLVEALLKGRPL